jgi:hypothetical protein
MIRSNVMPNGEIEVVISKKTGNAEIEMKGFKGNACAGQADEFIKAIGSKTHTEKRRDFYQEVEGHVKQSN